MMPPRFAELTEAVLYELYLNVAVKGLEGGDAEHIAKQALGGRATRSYVHRAMQYLLRQQFVEEDYDRETDEEYFSITDRGIEHIDEQREVRGSPISNYMNIGQDWLFRSDNSESSDEGHEASLASEEDIWEPLKIDRAAPEYERAVEAIDDAIEKIEGDNGYAATQPDERNNVVWSLKEGITAIKEMAPSLAQIRALIMAPLNSAIRTLKESGPGLAAMLAREALKEWLKSLFR